MPKLPRITPKKLLKIMKKIGYEIDHQTGSHIIMYHEKKDFPLVIPFHNKDLKIGTLSAIIKQSGLSNNEFIDIYNGR